MVIFYWKLNDKRAQKYLYLTALYLWTFVTFYFHDFKELWWKSSIGIQYIYIFCPIELLLVIQSFKNTFIGWISLFSIYSLLVAWFVISTFFEIRAYSDDLGLSYYVIGCIVLLICSIGGYLLYNLRPR